MKMLFILLGFSFFAKGFTDYTVTGVVKGSVEFICDSDKQRELKYLYFQGGKDFKIFLNGWHSSKSFKPTRPETTSVNHTERTISMWDLKVSDEGRYKCIISYKDSLDGTTEDTIIHLKMTANHSAPTITHRNCEKVGEGYCTLTCTAIGVFPVSKIAWDVPLVLEQRWTEVNHSDTVVQDINTLLYNISSTANFSCPGELQQNTNCSVGGVSSVKTPVCQQHNDEPTNSPGVGTTMGREVPVGVMAVAGVLLRLFLLVIVVVVIVVVVKVLYWYKMNHN
ncbi:hypothetical protein N1851_034438 [Merluccius polli]|uniref:Ig-like domain-containing protein n=1 Tax=Merluccius polli TaxID=89951 RepID=A0AA47LZT8_MERPO|nr:hypothetical protein N1851_034438 [Merluccius polli]